MEHSETHGLDGVLTQAVSENAFPEAAKVLALKITTEVQLEGRWSHEALRAAQSSHATNYSPVLPLGLYARSFFLAERPLDDTNRDAVSHGLRVARAEWPRAASRQSQVQLVVLRATPAPDGAGAQETSAPIHPGEELLVRLQIRGGEDFEFVHVRDQRGSALEPVDTLSQHRMQCGLVFYESIRDTATDFYFERLPRGVYVLEYRLRAVHRGRVQQGHAEIECFYAPEFRSHTPGQTLEIH